jgi:hypothetical protein
MDKGNQDIERDSMEAEYGDDILYAGWNPEVDLMSQQLQLVLNTEQRDISAESATKAAEQFLGKMYFFQL